MSLQTPEHILRSVFGYDQFKPLQSEIIENVLQKRDTLVIMPTGGGKSLCYQLPALIFDGLTIVVSPLIALMKDQVEQMQALGVPAIFLNSSLSATEYQENIERVSSGEVKLLYTSPETLLSARLQNLLAQVTVDCFTIDEAHCISEWGHDFRPEYRQLAGVRRRFPKSVCLAMTATATQRVRADIKAQLNFQESNEFIASFNRPNLFIQVIPKSRPTSQVLSLLPRFTGQSGIIYCLSRRQVDELAADLARSGYSARPYHAGLEDQQRKANQEAFIRDDIQIIVATIAFGMGINKSNVRFIIHYDLPKSLEGYYQEIGRAGRDGLPAHCLLLYSYSDVHKLKFILDEIDGDETRRQVVEQQMEAMTRYAGSDVCRRVPLLAYFGETYTTENCGACDNCMAGQKKLVDITIPAQKFLSCVKRTNERFGAGHITDVLLGSQSQKVIKYGHQNLSTYGIGKELTHKQWLHIARQLVQKGLLTQEDYSVLKLTPQAYEALKKQTLIQGVLEEEKQVVLEKSKPSDKEQDAALFELLRKKRKELADAAHVPPYVIFSDRTLVEMATYYPTREDSMLQINGVGDVKFARYGQVFMDLIREYCQARGLQEKLKLNGTPPMRAANRAAAKPNHVQVGEAYNRGASVPALVQEFQIQQRTILNYLARYAREGNPLRADPDLLSLSALTAAEQTAVLATFANLGADYLNPIFDHFNGAISYDELSILRLYSLSRTPQK